MSLKVLIVGGGMGGLCLAQGLRKAGVPVAVYERDASAHIRGQGYRFRMDAEGDQALRECLPSHLYALYQATANQPDPPPVGAYDYQLNLIYRLETPQKTGHLAVNRFTLRQVLLGELDEVIHFDHRLTAFTQDAEQVSVHFSNGETATGDVLVAADGIHSRIRRQLLPHAEILDTGMCCTYGKTLLNEEILREMPETLFHGFTPVLGPNRATLAMGLYRPCRPFADAVAEFAPAVRLYPEPPYLMWIFVAPVEDIVWKSANAATPDDPMALHRSVLERTREWHPDLRRLLELADVPSTFFVSIRTSRPVPFWKPSRVTLLGDAIHAMTPAGGIGANTAFRDAALLTRLLSATGQAEGDLIATITLYEAWMREYGFAAVARSLQAAQQLYRVSVSQEEALS